MPNSACYWCDTFQEVSRMQVKPARKHHFVELFLTWACMNSWRSMMSFCLSGQGLWVGGFSKEAYNTFSLLCLCQATNRWTVAVQWQWRKWQGPTLNRCRSPHGSYSLYWMEVGLVGWGVVGLYWVAVGLVGRGAICLHWVAMGLVGRRAICLHCVAMRLVGWRAISLCWVAVGLVGRWAICLHWVAVGLVGRSGY